MEGYNLLKSKITELLFHRFTSGIFIEWMIKPGLTNALKSQCRLKNSEDFLETNSSISTLETYIATKIYPHGNIFNEYFPFLF